MSLEPQFRIRDELYPIPQNERLGELRLIERVTGITHREFRGRAIDQQERIAALDDDANGSADLTPRQVLAVLDDIVTVGRIAQAIQRAHPGWATERVATFVDELDEGDVIMEGGGDDDDELPPVNGEPDGPSSSPSGTGSAPLSSSDSVSGSSESPTPASSGPSTSPTSLEARSDPTA